MGQQISLSYLAGRDVALRLRELIRQTCEAFEIRIISGVISKDHVHLYVSAPPNMAPSEIMRRIKGRTSAKLFEEFPHLKKRYWGGIFEREDISAPLPVRLLTI